MSGYPTNVLQLKEPEPVSPRNLNIYEVLSALTHFECQQNPLELEAMLKIVKGKTSLLEIGSNFGGTLYRMAKVLAPNSLVVSLDLPEPLHTLMDPVVSLKHNCQRIGEMGHNVQLFIGDSHGKRVREEVAKFAPFDFIFIDGDHSYEGVKRDWIDYGPMGKIVGFHDIAGSVDGCVRFWKELKAETKYRTEEFDFPRNIEDYANRMLLGIGIVYRES